MLSNKDGVGLMDISGSRLYIKIVKKALKIVKIVLLNPINM